AAGGVIAAARGEREGTEQRNEAEPQTRAGKRGAGSEGHGAAGSQPAKSVGKPGSLDTHHETTVTFR
ncbi:hypothetical protein Q6296_27740, partial [Klebsiella variicola]|uniref:hypothetical protein n=1 Tax=Klebsiella variicola TaxID=244366 RepID=UPI0027312C40